MKNIALTIIAICITLCVNAQTGIPKMQLTRNGFSGPDSTKNYVVLDDRDIFAFAGLWSEWKSKIDGSVFRSFTIMTTAANETVGKVHDPKFRMPVILDRREEALWLSKDISVPDLISLCDPYPDDNMSVFEVSTSVNSTVVNKMINNHPGLIEPLNSL